MIRSTISTAPQNETNYPCLKKATYKDSSCIVLFESRSIGYVLACTGDEWELWQHKNCWLDSDFTMFNGSITLSNEV